MLPSHFWSPFVHTFPLHTSILYLSPSTSRFSSIFSFLLFHHIFILPFTAPRLVSSLAPTRRSLPHPLPSHFPPPHRIKSCSSPPPPTSQIPFTSPNLARSSSLTPCKAPLSSASPANPLTPYPTVSPPLPPLHH